MFNATVYDKIKSKVFLSKEGTELKVTFKTYDSVTGEEKETIKETLRIQDLELQKSFLEVQIQSINNLILELRKIK